MAFETEMILAPLIIFIVIVMPIWIVFHYITLWKRERRAHRVDKSSTQDLRQLAERLEERLDAIERILDVDAPDWRSH